MEATDDCSLARAIVKILLHCMTVTMSQICLFLCFIEHNNNLPLFVSAKMTWSLLVGCCFFFFWVTFCASSLCSFWCGMKANAVVSPVTFEMSKAVSVLALTAVRGAFKTPPFGTPDETPRDGFNTRHCEWRLWLNTQIWASVAALWKRDSSRVECFDEICVLRILPMLFAALLTDDSVHPAFP